MMESCALPSSGRSVRGRGAAINTFDASEMYWPISENLLSRMGKPGSSLTGVAGAKDTCLVVSVAAAMLPRHKLLGGWCVAAVLLGRLNAVRSAAPNRPQSKSHERVRAQR